MSFPATPFGNASPVNCLTLSAGIACRRPPSPGRRRLRPRAGRGPSPPPRAGARQPSPAPCRPARSTAPAGVSLSRRARRLGAERLFRSRVRGRRPCAGSKSRPSRTSNSNFALSSGANGANCLTVFSIPALHHAEGRDQAELAAFASVTDEADVQFAGLQGRGDRVEARSWPPAVGPLDLLQCSAISASITGARSLRAAPAARTGRPPPPPATSYPRARPPSRTDPQARGTPSPARSRSWRRTSPRPSGRRTSGRSRGGRDRSLPSASTAWTDAVSRSSAQHAKLLLGRRLVRLGPLLGVVDL